MAFHAGHPCSVGLGSICSGALAPVVTENGRSVDNGSLGTGDDDGWTKAAFGSIKHDRSEAADAPDRAVDG